MIPKRNASVSDYNIRKGEPRWTNVMPGGHSDTSARSITKIYDVLSMCLRAAVVSFFKIWTALRISIF